jgi:hypothetical protein
MTTAMLARLLRVISDPRRPRNAIVDRLFGRVPLSLGRIESNPELQISLMPDRFGTIPNDTT